MAFSNTDNFPKGKLANSSKEFRALFLLFFTKELIKHSKISDVDKLETIIKKKILPPKKDDFDKIINPDEMMPSMMYQNLPMPRRVSKPPLKFPASSQIMSTNSTNQPISQGSFMLKKRYERIPEPQLPPQLQYIKPVPTETHLDLGKLNQIMQNPEVMSIECNGPEEPLNIKGTRGANTLNMNLSKEEISSIIQKFSEATKIPAHEGIFKVASGNLIISAIISDVVGSRFIIRKMAPQNPMIRY
ncbi:hypothetical protein HY212_04520 [Candidatus Pacearchaeota archaeon]|nr:hypothetical protein [Candidatus Pacearchaeota archaeon]